MDTRLTRVVSAPLERAEVAIRSMQAQGFQLTHTTATQSSGVMSSITMVMIFQRSKDAVANDLNNAANRPIVKKAEK